MKDPGTHGPSMLSIKKVAVQLDVSESTVRRLIGSNELPSYRIGGQVRIAEKDLEIFVKTRRQWPNN